MKVLLILTYIINIASLMIGLDKLKTFCLNKELKEEDTLQGSFVVSGEQEDLLYVTLKNKQNTIVYENKLTNGQFDYKGEFAFTAQSGNYTYCFESKAKTDIIISFDIYTLKESGHIINLVKDGKIGDLNKNLTALSYLFEEIDKNLKYYTERRTIHSKIIHDIISTVKRMSMYKILIMFMIFLVHVYLLKKFFANVKTDSSI
jgi:hypothetical protein